MGEKRWSWLCKDWTFTSGIPPWGSVCKLVQLYRTAQNLNSRHSPKQWLITGLCQTIGYVSVTPGIDFLGELCRLFFIMKDLRLLSFHGLISFFLDVKDDFIYTMAFTLSLLTFPPHPNTCRREILLVLQVNMLKIYIKIMWNFK